MRKTIYLTGLILPLCMAFAPVAQAQGVLDSNLYTIAPEITPTVAMEPLALPDATITPAAGAPSWMPRLPTIRSTLQIRHFYRDEQRADGRGQVPSDSLSSFDIPNARFYFTGEAFRGLGYQVAFRVSTDSATQNILKDAFLTWRPHEQFAFVPKEFNLLMGQFPQSGNPARASSHVNRLQAADAPFALSPPTGASARIRGIQPQMSFLDGRVNAFYELANARDASGSAVNAGNHMRHTVALAVSPLGRFPISPAAENDLRRSPFNVNLGYGYTLNREALDTAAVNHTRTTDAHYHQVDAVAVWQGLFLWYKFIAKDAEDRLGATRFDGGGTSHRATVSYAIKTSWGDLVPWYQFNLIDLDDRNVLRNGAGNISGATIDIGGAGTEVINGVTRTAQIKEHWIGLNLYLAGEALAIKPYVKIDPVRDNHFFVLQLQHQFFFNPEGKYR